MSEPEAASWTVAGLLRTTAQHLERKGIASARLDAELMLRQATGLGRLQLYLEPDRPVSEEERDELRALLRRRAAHEPMAYILGEREFHSLPLAVGPGVLIPRPETELLADWVLEALASRAGGPAVRTGGSEELVYELADPHSSEETAASQAAQVSAAQLDGELTYELEDAAETPPEDAEPTFEAFADPQAPPSGGSSAGSAARSASPPTPEAALPGGLVLDIGTGSAALAVVAAAKGAARVVAVDISEEALAYARRNVEAHDLTDRVALRLGDSFSAVPERFLGRFDVVVSNPPYVPEGDRPTLAPDVRDFEPARALFAPGDGTPFHAHLAAQAGRWLKPGGWLLMELGRGQHEVVRGLLEAAGFVDVEVRDDYARIARMVGGRWPGAPTAPTEG